MKAANALRAFFNRPGLRKDMYYPKCQISEIKEFKEACTQEEWQESGRQACEAMGEVFEPVDPAA